MATQKIIGENGNSLPFENFDKIPLQSSSSARKLRPREMQLFLSRVANDLTVEPLRLPALEHRKRLAELLAVAGGLDHFKLLNVEVSASETAIHAAYLNLARQVHPSHAKRAGLSGKEKVLEMLFEQATAAYTTLSDHHRRRNYQLQVGIKNQCGVDPQQRAEEKRNLARRNYKLAKYYFSIFDFSVTVDLMKEATRLDPQAHYFVLLAKAQAKNPRWRRQAVFSYRRANRLDSQNTANLLALGHLLEQLEELDEARACYQQVLEVDPQDVVAQAALSRLGGSASNVGEKIGGAFKNLLRF